MLPLAKGDNHKKFMRWLFGLGRQSGSQAYMAEVAKTVNKISRSAKSENKNNPFIKDPTKDYNTKTNPLLSCRRNHLLIFSDGEWGSEDFGGAYKKFKVKSTETKRTLRDGINYQPISPYKREINSDFPAKQRSLADIAFTAWATDLDGDDSNNKYSEKNNNAIPPYYPLVDGVIQEHNGSSYWHPYNDPAEWQHVNTHTIGFDLDVDDDEKIARINPPIQDADGKRTTVANGNENQKGIRPEYLKSDWVWKFDDLGAEISKDDVHKDMASAALAGRGRFYNARNAKELKEAILEILDMINEAVVTPGVKGSAGTLASIQSGGNSFYSTRYDSGSFTGEMVRRNLFDGDDDKKEDCFTSDTLNKLKGKKLYGRICDKSVEWNAAKVLVDDYGTKFAKRKVFTVKRNSTGGFEGQAFAFKNLTAEQKTRIKGSGFPTTFNSFKDDNEKFAKLVNYLLGDKEQEAPDAGSKSKDGTNKFRSRKTTFEDGTSGRNILGAIMRSSPLVSGIPRVSELHPDKQSLDYINFVKRYLYTEKKDNDGKGTGEFESLCKSPSCVNPVAKDNVDIVYVGANDGMLHAFRAKDGKEVFAYLPDAVYHNLTKLTEDRKPVSFIDGNIGIVVIDTIDKVTRKKTWRKFLTGSMGGGAKGIYTLDVTDPTASGAKPKDIVQWEFTDKDSDNIGNIIGLPGTVQLNDGTWVVVVGNGYNSKNNKAALIMINAQTGKLIQEVVLDKENKYTNKDLPNGLAPAFFQVFPGKTGGKTNGVDRAYAGDLQGNMWVFDFTKASKSGGVKVVSKPNKEKPLFVAQYKDSSGKMIKQPITVAPLVRQHPTKYGNIVHFGTGALFEENDLSSGITNSIYAIWDDWMETGVNNGGGLPVPRTGIVVERAHLRELTFEQANGEDLKAVGGADVVGRTLKQADGYNTPIQWATSGNSFSTKKRGWYVNLPVGERAWQSPYYTFGSNNTEAVGYDTVNYSPKKVGNDTSAVEGCGQSSTGAISWKMAFNIDDGTQFVPRDGTIDTDGDGNVTEKDRVKKQNATNAEAKTLTGLLSSGVNFSGKSVSTFSPLEEIDDNSGGLTAKGVCKYITEAKENNKGEYTSKQVCRRSHTGSWVELR